MVHWRFVHYCQCKTKCSRCGRAIQHVYVLQKDGVEKEYGSGCVMKMLSRLTDNEGAAIRQMVRTERLPGC